MPTWYFAKLRQGSGILNESAAIPLPRSYSDKTHNTLRPPFRPILTLRHPFLFQRGLLNALGNLAQRVG